MWHWNSFWARAPGDPPTLVDPQLWQAPWAPDQLVALQARSWETLLGATQSWWSLLLPASPLLSAWAPVEPLTALAASASSSASTPRKAKATPAKRAPARKRAKTAARRKA